MAWNAWVQIVTKKHGGVSGGLYGLDSGAAWATEGTAPEPAFVGRIYAVIAGKKEPSDLQAAGPTNHGVKFMITQATPDLIMGKKEGNSFIATKSGKAMLLFVWGNGLPPNVVLPAIEGLKASLQGSGF